MPALNPCCSLLLWMYLLTFAQCARGCTLEDFKRGSLFDANFDLSNLRQSYALGDTTRVPCKVGHRGFFKLTCSMDGWIKHGSICTPISCGHPGDVQFADFELVSGDDYVFGSQVRYTCHKGYQMTSITATRNCLQGGWDGHLPMCEAVPCPVLTVDDNVLVNGDMEEPTSGSVLQFHCRDRGYELNGPSQIFCGENGKWSDTAPSCREISCPKPQLDSLRVENEKMVYKENEVLRYSCNEGYKKVDGRPSVCLKVGLSAQWTPTPQCALITCNLSPNPPVGTTYQPGNQIIFNPGQRVRVMCGNKEWVKSPELQTAELVCQKTGNWDSEPVCQVVKCYKTDERVQRWEYYWNSIDIDETVWYRCSRNYKETSLSGTATCTRQGWDPNPLCTEKRCAKPSHKNAEITDYQYDKYNHDDSVNFKCTYEPSVTFSRYCYYGEWRGRAPTCKERPCTTEPNIENGEMVDNQKDEYNHGDSLDFRCLGKTDTFRVICNNGKWKTRNTCADVKCKTQPAIKNAAPVTLGQPPYPHGGSMTLRCSTGAKESFTVTCQSGEWETDHQCQEPSSCGKSEIKNGFSHEHENKLYYTCSPGFKLLTEGWWDEASCVEGQWKTQECVDSTDCGPVPDIPNLNVTYKNPTYSEGFTIPIQCEPGYHNPNTDLTAVTCKNGAWISNQVDFKQICTPIENQCNQPPKVINAVILAEVEEKYLSGTVLTYKCREGYTMKENDKNEIATVQCNNGTWEQKSIRCIVACALPASNPKLNVSGAEGDLVAVGGLVTVHCESSGSSKQLQCLPSGHWNSTFPTCSSSCDVENVPDSVRFSPASKRQLQRGQSLVFQCERSGHVLEGQAQVMCLEDGQWSHPFPSCKDPYSCEAPPPLDNGNVIGSSGLPYGYSSWVQYQCQDKYIMQGGPYKTCYNGVWTGDITCLSSCDVENVPDSVRFSPASKRQLQRGQSLVFQCERSGHVLEGQAQVMCLEDGQWSHPFPSCKDPYSCGTPPPLDNGDFFTSSGPLFGHNSKVQYQCQDKYIMQGGPYKTCYNGVWTGDITCLKPCTVNPDLMTPNKIDFEWSTADKLYAPHDDYLEFRCIPGARHDGVVNMRQKCNDGEIRLPKCV